MTIEIKNGMPYVTVILVHRQREIVLNNVLLDTGSYGCLFPIDVAVDLGIKFRQDDELDAIAGVGGTEFIVHKQIDGLKMGTFMVESFEIDVGAMNYSFEINGIIGMTFLHQMHACIDLGKNEIYASQFA